MIYILVAVVLLILVAWVVIYNGLVSSRNEVENGWAQIDVQLKRRHDLVPTLVATVKGAAQHEREVLERVTEARAQAMAKAGRGIEQVAAVGLVESLLTSALGGLQAVMENYPDLKVAENYRALQEELASTENRIAFARQAFNDAVALYNTRRESFPGVLIAGGFPRREFLEIEVSAKALPEVDLNA